MDLAAVSTSGLEIPGGYRVTGVVRNFGPGTYVTGRTLRFERWTGSAWAALTPSQPLAGVIPAGATRAVHVNLGAAPAAGTPIRLHLNPGDPNPGNDNSPAFTVVALSDLRAQSVAVNQTATGLRLTGQVRNNGSGVYSGGRTFRFEKRVGNTWVPLTANTAVPGGPLAAGASRFVVAFASTALPHGTRVRLRVSPGANNTSPVFTVP
jgi:hypothetical protein